MTHTKAKSRPRAAIPVALLAATLAFTAPLLAQTADVVIRAPGAGDAGTSLTLNETTENIAGSLLAYVARIDGVTRDYRSCLETAARQNGADTTTERRACAVTLQGAKIDMLQDLRATMDGTGKQFYALAERVTQMINDTGRDIETAKARVAEIETEMAMVTQASRGFFTSLSREDLTRAQKKTARAILWQIELSRIDRRRAEKAMAALVRKQQWLADGQIRITAWADTVTGTGQDLAIPILLAEESIEDIQRNAEWAALVSGSTGVPATLNELNDVFGEVRRFNAESAAAMDEVGGDDTAVAVELPGPSTTDDAALYDSLAKLFQQREVNQ